MPQTVLHPYLIQYSFVEL
ncbi:hypothetical protein Hypma_000168 [Hypsizygus marmoreus]|uniref:Uncharacterized protein n=1 Tax=Hypsizygus marmoreus TaxID=39966 RepID=A0A369KC54_HYPMA|nr:hypothetical protein Hypma_000168 [Hypsizygus marmoreus]